MLQKQWIVLLMVLFSLQAGANDTLYFRIAGPGSTHKNRSGPYLRTCVQELDYYHVWDYNPRRKLVAEGYYSDTSFQTRLFCHSYFHEIRGYLAMTRCYDGAGRLQGSSVTYNEMGDTTLFQEYLHGALVDKAAGEEAITFTQQEASFPGGPEAWHRYLADNVKVPAKLLRQGISGKLVVKVHLDQQGAITSVDIVKGLHQLLDEEVIRIIKNSPKWMPASQNGRPVRFSFLQPLAF